jgi:hypothetical protein
MKAEAASHPEYNAFKALLTRVLTVPHSVIVEREVEYQRQSKLNPNRRGPKPQTKRGRRAPAA